MTEYGFNQEDLDAQLFEAVSTNSKLQQIKKLLELGANPDGSANEPGLPLCYAYTLERPDLIDALLAAGADINSSYCDILEQAVKKGDLQNVMKFVDAGADINSSNFIIDDDLLNTAKSFPKVQQYLMSKQIATMDNHPELSSKSGVILYDYSKKYIVARGDTKKYQTEFRNIGGRYQRKLKKGGKGWLFPISKRAIVEAIINAEPAVVEVDEPITAVPLVPAVPVSEIVKPKVERPVAIEEQVIRVGSPKSQWGIFSIDWTRPALLVIDGKEWNSVGEYLKHKTNKHNLEELFYFANKEKFAQNNLLKQHLRSTGSKPIVNVYPEDHFGYPGNLLGNTLMQIRQELGGKAGTIPETNNLSIQKYGNRFYIIRGDADPELAKEIRKLGTYKNRAGKTIRGKYHENLGGWLIPKSNRREAKRLVFETYPDDKKLSICGKDWIKKEIKLYLEIAYLFARLRKKSEIGFNDVMFAIKDFFRRDQFLGIDNKKPEDEFKRLALKYTEKQNIGISDAAIKLLWDFISKLLFEITVDVDGYLQFKNKLADLDNSILNSHIELLKGINEQETIYIKSFDRIYKLLLPVAKKPTQACITTVGMLTGHKVNEFIKNRYQKLSQKSGNDDDEIAVYRDRFGIQLPHLEAVIGHLPEGLPKKCKLLVLIGLDQLFELQEKQLKKLTKRLIVIS